MLLATGIMTVLPVSMYQTVQAMPTASIPVNFQLAQPANQSIQVTMATNDVAMAINQQLQGGVDSQGGGDMEMVKDDSETQGEDNSCSNQDMNTSESDMHMLQ